jgi:hypothetical protein
MTDKSHREEMSAAIRAQRERQAVPRSIPGSEESPAAAPAPDPEPTPQPEPEPAARKGFLARLLGR